MKVLFVANTLPPDDLSGVGEQVMQLAAGLRGRGHEVEVLGRGGRGAKGSKLLFPLRIVGPALRRFDELRPDIVQLHESDGGLLALAFRRRIRRARPARPASATLVSALLQVSYVEERRSVRPLIWRGQILGRPSAEELRFRRFKAPLQIALGRRTVRYSDLVFAPSRATAAELERDYAAAGVQVLPNIAGPFQGPPRTIAELEPLQGAADAPFLFVGRLRIRKGVEVLLAALSLLGEEGVRPPLWIVGAGEHGVSLADDVRRRGLASQVRFLGRRSAAEIRWALARARALVVPSIYEGMPLVILEAMSAARAVIASRVSGIPEVVIDGETGWLVATEDPASLARTLAAAWTAPEEAARRGQAGERRVELRYRSASVAELWESTVERRLRERGGR